MPGGLFGAVPIFLLLLLLLRLRLVALSTPVVCRQLPGVGANDGMQDRARPVKTTVSYDRAQKTELMEDYVPPV